MSNDVIHTTGKLSDSQILALFNAIATEFETDAPTFACGPISASYDDVKALVNKERTFFVSRASCNIEAGKITVQYMRGESTLNSHQNTLNVHLRTPSPYFDEIIITPTANYNNQPQRPTIQELAKLEKTVRSYIILKQHKDIEAAGGSAIDVLQKELAALTEVHGQLIRDTVELRQVVAKEHEAKLAEIVEREKKGHATLIADKDRIEKELATQKETLEAKQKELDDRNHMHVRRALRGQITDDIKARVSGTLLTRRSRVLGAGVFVLSLICAAGAGWFSSLSYAAFADVLAQKPESFVGREWALLVLGIRTTLAVLASLGFLVYALTWLRRTYDEDVKLNNDLQRYALDLNRASWVIETVMEMSAKEGQTPPAKWVDGVTHGMFQAPGYGDDGVTPLEALGTLLNVTARAEVGPNGTKLEFDGKNLKKIAKSGESTA
jgi:hypothetical protein